jgi:hypothetical protein
VLGFQLGGHLYARGTLRANKLAMHCKGFEEAISGLPIGTRYDADHQVRRVRSTGEIMWKGERICISEALVGELVGIAELEGGDQVVRFCDLDIGLIDACGRFSRFAPPRDRLREPTVPNL